MRSKNWTFALLLLAAVLLFGRRAGAGETGGGGNGGGGDGGLYPVGYGETQPFPRVQLPGGAPAPADGFARPAACSQYSPPGECLPWGTGGPAMVQEPIAIGQPVAVVGVIPATGGFVGGGTGVVAYSPVPGTMEPFERELAFAGASRHRVGNIAQSEVF